MEDVCATADGRDVSAILISKAVQQTVATRESSAATFQRRAPDSDVDPALLVSMEMDLFVNPIESEEKGRSRMV